MKFLTVCVLLVAAVAVCVDGASIDPAQVEIEESEQGERFVRRAGGDYCPFPPGFIPVAVVSHYQEPTCSQKCYDNHFNGGACYSGFCACYH